MVTPAAAGSFELGTDGPTAILVGVDGSATSLRAAAYAAGLARRQGAGLVVVYVESLSGFSAGVPFADEAFRQAHAVASDIAAADLRLQAEEMAAAWGVRGTFIAAQGDSLAELHRIASEVSADAIVVGASAKAGHRLAGSLAVRLVRAAKWPVTVVP